MHRNVMNEKIVTEFHNFVDIWSSQSSSRW